MVELAAGGRPARAARLVRQLHQPGRASSPRRSSTCSATAPSGSATRPPGLFRRVAGRSSATRTSCGSTTSASTTSAGCAASTTASATCCPGCWRTTSGSSRFEEGRLFGGEWLRSLGMIPNEYLFFHYFSSDTVGAIRSGLESRGEFLLHQQAAFYEANGRTPDEALEAWRATRREREELLRRGARGGGPGAPSHEWEDVGGYEGQAIALVEAIALQRAPRADPEHRQPQQPAVPRRARRRRGAVHHRHRRRRAVRGRRRARPRPRADRGDQGRRAH